MADYERSLRALGERQSIYCKLSAVLHRVDGQVHTDLASHAVRLDRLYEAFGADRVLFGSDWPNSDGTAELVDSLLEMARLQSGRVMLRRDWQSLEELAGTAIASIDSALSAHDVAIEIDEGFPLLDCDGALIERVLVNLLENAARHTPPGTRIVLSGAIRDGTAEISVEDSGPGLPPGEPEALFEKFVRGRKESAVSGMGLGLAICRTIVEAHGGAIRAERRAEGGARFVVTLPLATPPSIETEPASTVA